MWAVSGSLLLTAFLTPLCGQAQKWQSLEKMPEGRSGVIAFVTEQNEIAYYGGTAWTESEKHTFANGYRLTNKGWLPLDALTSPVAYAPHGQSDDCVLAFGGLDGNSVLPEVLEVKTSSSV